MTMSSPGLSASRWRSIGNELLPAFVPTITTLPLLRCGLVKPNCKSAWLRLLANRADGSRRTWTTIGRESSLFLQAIDMPSTKRTPNRKHCRIIKLPNKLDKFTSAANPPAPSHRARENTWPAPDTSAPPPHTSHRPRFGRKHAPQAWCAVRRCRRPRRSPF